jgi:cytoskeletal protein CcmA (bactofilin family)
MFGKNDMKSSEKNADLNTILGKGTVFEGNIRVEHSLRVDGVVKGDVNTTDTLVIGKDGQVIGNIKVKSLILGGKLKGNARVSDIIVLESKSEFNGEMITTKLIIDEGAIFDGKCSMGQTDENPAEENIQDNMSSEEQ